MQLPISRLLRGSLGLLSPDKVAPPIIRTVRSPEPSHLHMVSTVRIPATEHFVVGEHFVPGYNRKTGVRIARCGRNLIRQYVGTWLRRGLVELPADESLLVCYESPQGANPAVSLGEHHQTRCAQIDHLMQKHARGEESCLVADEFCSQYFYVLNIQGVPGLVCVTWSERDRGWNIDSGNLQDPVWRWGRYRLFVAVT